MAMLKFLLRCFLVLLLSMTAEACDTEWSQFLATPTKTSHDKLIDWLVQCHRRECQKLIRPTSSEVTKLVGLIDARDSLAIDIGFSALPSLDGGDLEDVVRSLAGFIEVDPDQFLTAAKKNDLSVYLLRKMLLMLPLDTVDDVEARASILQKRIDGLESVDQAALLPIRDKALQILKSKVSKSKK